jgi:hypothetical protein
MTNSFAAFIRMIEISRLTINLGLRYDIFFAPTFPTAAFQFSARHGEPAPADA